MDWIKSLFGTKQKEDVEIEVFDGFNFTPQEKAEQIVYKQLAREDEQMKDIQEERQAKESAVEGQLLVINGAKIKMNGHVGTFNVLQNVPTTQEKPTGTTVEKQIPNFTFDDGFQLLSIDGDWQKVGSLMVQENLVLIKDSTISVSGKMPGNAPVEKGMITFTDSGQINEPEGIDIKEGAPVPMEEMTVEGNKCYCNRDFTEEELRNIVIQLRSLELYLDNEKKYVLNVIRDENKQPILKDGKKQFRKRNMFDEYEDRIFDKKLSEKLKSQEANFESFVKTLNITFKKYDINTCIRKIHFIAQTYHETERFRLTYEEDNSYMKDYRGGRYFRGRGLLQITHDDWGYLSYYKFLNPTCDEKIDSINRMSNFYKDTLIPFCKKLSTQIYYACDSAGWNWKYGGVPSVGENINSIADKDNVLLVSRSINGNVKSPNGLKERELYTSILKQIMTYENCENK